MIDVEVGVELHDESTLRLRQFVVDGQHAEVVASDEYRRDKAIYAAGMTRAFSRLRQLTAIQTASIGRRAMALQFIGIVSLARPKPMPNRSGTPSTRSCPLDCSSKSASTPLSESSLVPRASPRQATMDWILATERALPCPLPLAISALFHTAEFNVTYHGSIGF